MRKALVVVNAVESADRVLREAGELAAGVGASLVVLHVASESEYEENREAMQSVTEIEGGGYDVDQASEGARQFAHDLCEQVLRNIDVEHQAIGEVGDEFDSIMGAVDDHDCDHVFMTGARRSPTGKAIFGDVAQQVLLNANRPVTVMIE